MISELVKGLRKLGNQWKHNDVAAYHMIFDAAYTIEMLSAKLSAHNLGNGGWIPVSEKPKDEKRTYLVQLDSGGMRSCRWTNANPIWTELTIDWHWNIFDIPQYCKVVAWMDLEPYKGGEDK